MFVKVQCTFCQQTFDFDGTSGIPRIDCPHCGRQNEIEEGTGQTHEPGPRGNSQTTPVKPCPACRRPVAHDAVLKVLICHLLDAPISSFWRFRLENGSITMFDVEKRIPCLCVCGDTCHLGCGFDRTIQEGL